MGALLIEVKVKDNEKARKQFAMIASDLRYKALRSGMVSASKPIKDVMKSPFNTPYLRGGLVGSVGHRQLSASAAGRIGFGRAAVSILVGATRPGAKRPAPGRKGLWHQWGTVKMEATPWITTAWLRSAGQFEELFFKGLQRWVNRNLK